MSHRDEYYNRAKQEGYRSRAAYKLQQLDAAADLFSPGQTVVDLGAAPGGWMQVAAEAVGPAGRVVGVDRQGIDSIDADATVETVRVDLTTADAATIIEDQLGDGGVDVVLSDMAPNLSGEYDLDHARSVHLARLALDLARNLLRPGGDVVIKVFDGRDLEAFVQDVDKAFEYAREIRPDASRDASSELYVVGKRFITAPVSVGDVLDVEITDTGAEGDGVALVDGFTLFVTDAVAGETVTVEVTDLKREYGFASPLTSSNG